MASTRRKYNEAASKYTKKQLNDAKNLAKDYFIKHNGECSVKVLSRVAKIPQSYVRDWYNNESWLDLVVEESGDKVKLSKKTLEVLRSSAEEFGISEEEELFCLHYLKTFNQELSAIRAGISPMLSYQWACKAMNKPHIIKYINHLKTQRNKEVFVDAMDVLDMYKRIAFADITDVLTFGPHGVTLKNSSKVDGQLINKVREGKDGITLELVDKLKPLEKLEKFTRMIEIDDGSNKNPLLTAVKSRMEQRGKKK